ncbi:hypothetical protein TNCV_4539821 [Trichonephila clavipes]|nr:hypothetical protein TNCV_4539821 [Trichonephila clavipes]
MSSSLETGNKIVIRSDRVVKHDGLVIFCTQGCPRPKSVDFHDAENQQRLRCYMKSLVHETQMAIVEDLPARRVIASARIASTPNLLGRVP